MAALAQLPGRPCRLALASERCTDAASSSAIREIVHDEQVGAGVLGGAIALHYAAEHPQLVGALALLAFDPGQPLPAFHPAQAAAFSGAVCFLRAMQLGPLGKGLSSNTSILELKYCIWGSTWGWACCLCMHTWQGALQMLMQCCHMCCQRAVRDCACRQHIGIVRSHGSCCLCPPPPFLGSDPYHKQLGVQHMASCWGRALRPFAHSSDRVKGLALRPSRLWLHVQTGMRPAHSSAAQHGALLQGHHGTLQQHCMPCCAQRRVGMAM